MGSQKYRISHTNYFRRRPSCKLSQIVLLSLSTYYLSLLFTLFYRPIGIPNGGAHFWDLVLPKKIVVSSPNSSCGLANQSLVCKPVPTVEPVNLVRALVHPVKSSLESENLYIYHTIYYTQPTNTQHYIFKREIFVY